MKDKKNIDRLFQENFKDFEESPSPKVWKNIESELKGKKKRRVIPLWYKIGGVAAVMALLFFAGNEIFSDQSITPVVNGERQRSIPEQTIKSEGNDILTNPENSVTSNDTDSSNSTSADDSSVVSAETKGDSNQYPNEKETKSVLNTSASEEANFNTSEAEVNVASNSVGNRRENAEEVSSEESKTREEQQQNSSTSEIQKRETQLASAEGKSKVSEQNESTTNKEGLAEENEANREQSQGIANRKENHSENQENINLEKENTKIQSSQESQLVKNEPANKSTLDTTQIANTVQSDSVGKKSLLATAEALQQQKDAKEEDDENEKTKPSKWLVNPNVSPIYYSSLNGGSTVDPKFSGSQGKGEVTMSYGINFAYQLSDKLKIRSGVSKVNMGYSTNDIAFTSSVNARALSGVKNSANAQAILVVNRAEASNEIASYAAREVSGNKVNSFSTGTINQQFGFLEVPVEIEYALLDKRFGINLIGGASTLFLNNNDVTINSAQGTTDLGEASNINKVSFTTNIGVGFGYDLTKTFSLNLEPTFKYQVNGFSGNTNGFQPYYFGVYTGFSFKF